MDTGGSMRCPRCAYKGKLFNGRCAVCSYPIEQDTQNTQEMTKGSTALVEQPFPLITDRKSVV